MADFVTYRDNPDQTTTFMGADGQALTATGPAAWQKKQEIDLANQSGAQPPVPAPAQANFSPDVVAAMAPRTDQLAENDTGAPGGYGNAGGLPPPPAQNATDAGGGDAIPQTTPAEDAANAAAAAKTRADYEAQAAARFAARNQAPTLTPAQVAENDYRAQHGLAPVEPTPAPEGHGAGGATPARKAVDPSTLHNASGVSGPRVQQEVDFAPQGAGGGHVVKGGMRVGSVSEGFTQMPPETAGHIQEGTAAQQSALEQMSNAEQIQGGEVAASKNATLRAVQLQEEQAQAADINRRAAMQTQLDGLKRRINDMSAEPIDSQRFWRNKSNGEKFAGAMAVALGAYGAAMTGGQNYALGIIDKAIDRDIDEQKTNAQNKRANVQEEMNLFQQNRAIFADDKAAESATRVQLLARGSMQVDAIVQSTNNPIALAKAQALKAQIDAKGKADLDQLKARQVQVHSQNVPDQYVGGGAAASGQQHVYDEDVKLEGTVLDLDGKRHAFSSEKAAEAANKQMVDLRANANDVDLLKQIVSNPANLASPDKRAQATVITRRIVARSKAAEGGDALTPRMNKEGMKMAEEAVASGDPLAFTNFGKSAALDEFKRGTVDSARGVIAQYSTGTVETPRVLERDKVGHLKNVMKVRRKGDAAPSVAPVVTSGETVGE